MSLHVATGFAASADVDRSPVAVRLWLWGIAGMVLAMIVVGGATRLTDSGLSITEWRPILGAIPPLSDADWQEAFAKYKQIPEYQLVNKGMSLAAFKVIYWWEWAHRFLGRIIGIAFALPLLTFWAMGLLPRGLLPRLLGVLALGGLQGAIGWYMVQSGLVDRVDVSQYRLALHLTVAFVILGLLVWLALDLAPARDGAVPVARARSPVRAWQVPALLVGLVLMQVVLGAFVAGLRAGLAYNTWPLMDGALIPTGLAVMSPWYLNLFENALTVQFNHRLLAYVVLAVVLAHAVAQARSRATPRLATSAAVLAGAVVAQAVIGIWTLLAMVPLTLGLLHQGGGAIVLALAVWHLHRAVRSPVA